MGAVTTSKLNRLYDMLPEGLVVDAAWLERRGYYDSLRRKYLSSGWLTQPARGSYQRPRGPLTWQQVVISLQALLDTGLVVGGQTALEAQGYAHYLPHEQREVHLFGHAPPPNWVRKLQLGTTFVFHRSGQLFPYKPVTLGLTSLSWDLENGVGRSNDPLQTGLQTIPYGHWNWPLTVSTPEKALLELLDQLPARESFHEVDMLMEGLANLSPRRLQKLLGDCRSVKVKRLFFYFADRHPHAWLKHIDRKAIDLDSGKRALVPGGKLDPAYHITVPRDLDAVQ